MQDKIIKEMKVKKNIDAQEEITQRVNFIKDQLLKTNLTGLVLGISGGQDSTLCGKLCQMAVEQLGENYTFHAVRLPYAVQQDEEDCQLALDFIKPSKTHVINIKSTTDSLVKELTSQGITISDFNKGNIKARARMMAQYALAGATNSLVVGTDHSSESVTGFFTKFGDGAFDISPLFGLNKRQGKMLLEYLECPEELYLKTPTADLEENKPQLSDEVALGFTYNELDDYLEGKEVSSVTKEKIEKKFIQTKHKRHLPYTIYDI